MAKLVINPGTPQANVFELKPGTNYLGRGFANDFKIDDGSVSTSHAEIVLNGGSVMVKDLGSTNGTFINRAPVTEAVLQPGQWLRLGGVEMLLESETAVTAPGTESSPQVANASAAPASGGLRIAASISHQPVAAKAAAVSAPAAGGLRIAGAHTATAPAPVAGPDAAPPMAPPMIAPVIQTGTLAAQKKPVCKFHPKSASRWLCTKCSQQYCDLCVSIRKTNDGTAHLCRSCGVECSPISMEAHLNSLNPGNFFKLLPGAFAYPFKNDGLLILIVGTVIIGLLRLAAHIPMIFFFLGGSALGYMFAYMQNVIMTTIGGDERKPDLPDTEELRGQGLQLLGTILVCFGPAIGLAVWAANDGGPIVALSIIPAVVFGCLYFPMAFLGVAVFSSVAAVNPILVVPSILKVPLQYLLTCVLLGMVLAARWAGDGILSVIIPIPIVPDIISSFVGLYFLTVQSRILGLLYYCNHSRLAWVRL